MSAPAVASLSCPQCGAAIELRTLDQAQSVVCSSCGSILDARDPNLALIQAFQAKQKFTPQIPLGTRGTLKGEKWEVVGYQVRSITFVFHDGTIRTIPEDREGNQQNNQQRDGLGWISDPHGIPCVSGERRSNAQQYLGTQALITAAGAGVASLIESDSGRASYVGADGSIGSVGISGQEAVGRILASGVQDMSSWVNKLYGQAFAAVYVQPGAKVAVHLEKPLAIDFDPEGRKVDHRAGESHALELD